MFMYLCRIIVCIGAMPPSERTSKQQIINALN